MPGERVSAFDEASYEHAAIVDHEQITDVINRWWPQCVILDRGLDYDDLFRKRVAEANVSSRSRGDHPVPRPARAPFLARTAFGRPRMPA